VTRSTGIFFQLQEKPLFSVLYKWERNCIIEMFNFEFERRRFFSERKKNLVKGNIWFHLIYFYPCPRFHSRYVNVAISIFFPPKWDRLCLRGFDANSIWRKTMGLSKSLEWKKPIPDQPFSCSNLNISFSGYHLSLQARNKVSLRLWKRFLSLFKVNKLGQTISNY